MTEVDTSMYPKLQVINPMDRYAQTVGIAEGMAGLQGRQQENKLLQMQVGAQQGLQNIFANPSTHNADGSPNVQRVMQLVTQNPLTARLAPEIAERLIAINHPTQTFQNGTPGYIGAYAAANRLGGAMQQPPAQQPAPPQIPPEKAQGMHSFLDNSISTMGELLTNPNLTSKDVAKRAADLVGDGQYMTPQAAAAEMAKMPAGGPELKDWVQQHYQRFLEQKAKLNQIAPQEQAMPQGMEEGQGNDLGQQPVMQQSQPALVQQPQQVQGGSQVTQGDPNFIPTGPKLGVAEQTATSGTEAGGRKAATIAAASDAPTRLNVMDNIIQLSKNTPTGPGQDWQNTFVGHLTNMPVVGATLDALGKDLGLADVKSYSSRLQELKKFMAQNGQRAWQASGSTGASANLAAFEAANPNDHMFPQAVQAMGKYIKGLDLMTMAKANVQDKMLQGSNDPADQEHFEKEWRNSVDPRVFQMQTMDPDEQMDMLKNMSKEQRATFRTKRNKLMDMGALEPVFDAPAPPSKGASVQQPQGAQ